MAVWSQRGPGERLIAWAWQPSQGFWASWGGKLLLSQLQNHLMRISHRNSRHGSLHQKTCVPIFFSFSLFIVNRWDPAAADMTDGFGEFGEWREEAALAHFITVATQQPWRPSFPGCSQNAVIWWSVVWREGAGSSLARHAAAAHPQPIFSLSFETSASHFQSLVSSFGSELEAVEQQVADGDTWDFTGFLELTMWSKLYGVKTLCGLNQREIDKHC